MGPSLEFNNPFFFLYSKNASLGSCPAAIVDHFFLDHHKKSICIKSTNLSLGIYWTRSFSIVLYFHFLFFFFQFYFVSFTFLLTIFVTNLREKMTAILHLVTFNLFIHVFFFFQFPIGIDVVVRFLLVSCYFKVDICFYCL